MAKIEPFTIEQAKNCIDIHVTSESKGTNPNEYNQIRDYIIEAFFQNQNEINHNQFIGYAIVFNAISLLLNEQKNYYNCTKAFNKETFAT